MERACEEARMEESARGGTRTPGWLGAQRGQEARQQTKRPQRRPGQKAARRLLPSGATLDGHGADTARESERGSSLDRARFGQYAVGRGYRVIRYVRVRLQPTV